MKLLIIIYHGKKILCTVQYPAIKAMIAEMGYTTLFLYQGFFPKGIMMSKNTAVITVICPISTPTLKENIDVKNLFLGKPISLRALAKPIPCTRPKINTMAIRQAFNSFNKIFSIATNMMDKAINGSTISAGSFIIPFMLKASVIVCATVNAVACQRIVLNFVFKRQRLITNKI
jgi:hypothetical protein